MPPRKSDFDSLEQDLVTHLNLPQCPRVDLLHASREGVLPDSEAQALRAHLEGCEICRLLLQDLDAIDFGAPTPGEFDRVRRRLARNISSSRKPAVQRWWIPALVVAACLVLAIFSFWSPRPQPSPHLAQTKPVPEIQLTKLPIRINPTSLLATRGSGNNTQPSGNELVKAFSRYQDDDFVGAVQQLKALAQKYPQDPTVTLYLGVSQLFLNQNAEAAASLETAKSINEGTRLADSQWYLAVAALRLQDTHRALPLLHDLCAGKSTYSERACGLESQLNE